MRFRSKLAMVATCSLIIGCASTFIPTASADTPVAVSVIAGTGVAGGTGDGGAATAAQISDLAGLAVDQSGRIDLYDRGERQIRRVDPSVGSITSVVGDGTWCNDQGTPPTIPITGMCPGAGLAIASNGTIYYGDNYGISQSVGGVSSHFAGAFQGTPTSADGPQASVLVNPSVIRVDPVSGEVYYLDSQGHGIRHIDASGNVTTPIGTSDAPNGCSVAPTNGMAAAGACFLPGDFEFHNDDIYFTDTDGSGVQYVLLDHAGVITIVAGNGTFDDTAPDGPAISTGMPLIRALTVAPDGSVFVAGPQRGRIWKITTSGNWQFVYEFQGGIPYLATDVNGNLFADLQYTYQIVELTGVSSATVGPTVCPSLFFIGVRGSGQKESDSGGLGSTVAAIAAAVKGMLPGIDIAEVNYQAISVGYGATDYGSDYVLSVNDGIQKLDAIFSHDIAQCQNTYVALAGYSQGAQVVGDEYLSLPAVEKSRVAAVVMIGDPKFNPDQPIVDVGDYNPLLSGIYQFIVPNMRVVPKVYQPSVRSYCRKGDPICNYSKVNASHCVPLAPCPHAHYESTSLLKDAANFIVKRFSSKKSL